MNWFKKYLAPGKHNDYNPHILREASTIAVFTLVLTLFFVAVSAKLIFSNTDLTALILPRVLVDYANEDRAGENYKQLAINPTLERAAQMKADDMAAKGYFAHTSPDGHSPWYWFGQAGYDFSYAGENLAVNFSESVDVNKAWMNSPGHRENIMNGNFSEIGIATSEGLYQGRQATFVVQLFGRPAGKVLSVKKIIPPTTLSSTTPKTTKTSVATTSKVLSESTSNQQPNEIFIATEKESQPLTDATDFQYSNSIEKVVSSPSTILKYSYLAIAFLLIIGLVLLMFSRIRNHKPRAIWLNLGILLVLIGLLYVYMTLLSPSVVII
jgi:hypothetical protein